MKKLIYFIFIFCFTNSCSEYQKALNSDEVALKFNLGTELYEAEKNKGSWLNSKKITTTNTKVLENCKMCAFKPMFSHPVWKRSWPKMQIMNKNSIAYRMALVSSGIFDTMMALNRKSDWDVAAGDLLITEAGGKVTDHKGNQLIYNLKDTSKKSIIGSCMGLHDKIIKRVKDLDL